MTKFHLFSQDSVRLETAPTGECISPMLISREVYDAIKPSHFRMSILRVAEKSPA